MPCIIVVGTQWGDEGKGKIIDLLTAQAHHVVRAQGGNNAGHTIVVDGQEYKLNLVPSGIIHPHTQCYLAAGMVIDLEILLNEIQTLQNHGITLTNRLWIAPQAHLILPYHRQLDSLLEQMKGGRAVGTTGRGIGPAYADKMLRIGIRVADLNHRDTFYKTLKDALHIKNKELVGMYGAAPLDFDPLYTHYERLAEQLKPYICDVDNKIHQALERNELILLEGAQGTFLDITTGTYPFVTSSSTTAAGICSGAGLGPRHIDTVLGITKAYTTRVGHGPLPSEIPNPETLFDHQKAREYGTTTGRKRRIGWFDACLLRKSIKLNSIDSLVVTKLDVLDDLEVIKIASGYRLKHHPHITMTTAPDDLSLVEPIYEELPGWQQSTKDATHRNQLPAEAIRYLDRLEELCGVPISAISVGPERRQTILLNDIFVQKEQPAR